MYCGFIIDFDCGSIVSLPLMIENLWWIDVSPLYKWSCKATSNWGEESVVHHVGPCIATTVGPRLISVFG